jgi:ribosome biogenesis GTPase
MFTVRPLDGTEGRPLECRIKGKILKGTEGYQNPLAPGDIVFCEEDPDRPGTGLIHAPEKRRNMFVRLNQGGLASRRAGAAQILAANADRILCVTTPSSPPFRPRFADRVLLQADAAGIPAAVLCNKWDLFDGDPDVEERLEDFSRIGLLVLRLSAKTGLGMDAFKSLIRNSFSVLVGQSGAGKSSLVNALLPVPRVRVGDMNEKYDRGSHTTTLSEAVDIRRDDGGELFSATLVDTPGIRLFIPHGVSAADVIFHMAEFAPIAGSCSYGLSCSHRTEPGCRIMEAVHAGVIHEDRYESFLRIREELEESRAG